ncbi:hypothetical protein YPPY55_3061, partial [Yersinia pestis PY-55]
MALILL